MQSSIQYLQLPDNYIYISHLGENGEYLILPTYPDTITDSMSSTFSQTNALSRSAPIYTYSNSGPREVQISLDLFRDMMDDFNKSASNISLELGQDYVDVLIKKIQAISVPKYNVNNKSVEPPTIAVRLGNEIFIKGIVTGQITVTYKKPILVNNKYSQVTIGFTVTETDPYDATSIEKNGSFRGVTRGMRKGFHLEN
jgi:hypothetical protein